MDVVCSGGAVCGRELRTFKLNLLSMMLKRDRVDLRRPSSTMVNELEDLMIFALSKGRAYHQNPVSLHLLWLKDSQDMQILHAVLTTPSMTS